MVMTAVWLQSLDSVNDILSVKKELVSYIDSFTSIPNLLHPQAEGSVDSLIPILHASLGNPQAAVDATVGMLQDSAVNFVVAASQLLQSYSNNVETYEKLRNFVEGCMNYCTGNLRWR